MLRLIGDHPFLFGTATSLAVYAALFSGLFGVQGHAQARGLGLIVFGAASALLLYQTRERDDIFWFFLGGVTSLVIAFLVSLKF